MSSTNKKGAGLILSLLTAVACAVGLGFCIVNAGTDSFRKIGTSPVDIGCAVNALLALVLRVVLDKQLAIAAAASTPSPRSRPLRTSPRRWLTCPAPSTARPRC